MRREPDRLKICFVSGAVASLFDPRVPPVHGGAELQMYLLATELAKDPGNEVHFMTDAPVADDVDTAPIRMHPYPQIMEEGLPGISAVRNLLRWFKSLRATDCRVFVQSSAGGPTGQIALSTRLLMRRFVFRLASDGDVDGSILAEWPKVRRLYLLGLHLADLVFSRSIQQQVDLKRLHGIRSTVLANGFPVPNAMPTSERAHVLWVASCQKLKQPEVFLDLAAEFPETKFLMVMPRRNPEYYGEVLARVRQTANVELYETVPLAKIQRLFDEAIVFVNTSTFEGFPNTFVQAMMGAAPILSLNVDPDGFLEKERIGFSSKGSYDVLCRQLADLLANPSDAHAMGERAWVHAQRNHDISVVAAAFKHAIIFRSRE